jgi:hypothetical protein
MMARYMGAYARVPRETKVPILTRIGDGGRWLLGACFIAAAGAIALQMAWVSGADDLRKWTMVAIAGAGLAVVGCGPALTIGRRRYLAAVLLLPVWLAAVAYNGTSALEFFNRYLADAEARVSREALLFVETRDELTRLRKARAAIKTVREVKTIEDDLAEKGLVVSRIADLKAEKAEAMARDGLDQRIKDAAARFSGADAHGAPAGDDDGAITGGQLSSVHAWISRQTGILVASSNDLRALLLLLITELGAALVPIAMALARKPSASAASVDKSLKPEAKPSEPSGLVPRGELQDLTLWLNHRTVRTAGGMADAASLYADYARWMGGRGKPPLSKTAFGAMMTSEAGVTKRKAGKSWTIHYQDIELRPVAAPRRPFGLLAISGGRAA